MQAVSPAILTTDQSEDSIKSVPMAQSTHSLLPGHMGPDVEVPTLRGADTHILQFSTMSKVFLKTTSKQEKYL